MTKLGRRIKKILPVATFVLLMLAYSGTVLAQVPDPPGGGGTGDNTGQNQTGGSGAPIGGGVFILLGLTAAYGTRKVLALNDEEKPDTEI